MHPVQCNALSKRTRQRCKAPAVKGKTKCRFHGGRSTGPKTAEGKAAIAKAQGALWISTRGAKMSGHALYYSVTRISEELLGSPINPHLLRDCAASAISSDAPENILAGSRILGHSNLDTTLHHYEQSSMLAAGETLIDAIGQIQRES